MRWIVLIAAIAATLSAQVVNGPGGGGGAPSGPAGGVLSGTYPNPGFYSIPTGQVIGYFGAGSGPASNYSLSAAGIVAGAAGLTNANAVICTSSSGVAKECTSSATIPALISTGSITSGSGGGLAGVFDLTQGTLPALGTTAISLMAPTSITSYGLLYPGAAPSANQFLLWGAPSSGISTGVFTGFTSTNLTDTATLAYLAGTQTFTGQKIFSLNGAVSAPPVSLTGTWVTGGSATTNKPLFLIEPSGTTSTGWNTSGTGLGINGATGCSGLLFDFQTGGASRLKLACDGTLTGGGGGDFTSASGVIIQTTSALKFGSRGKIQAYNDGTFQILNNNASTGVNVDVSTDGTMKLQTRGAADTAIFQTNGLNITGSSFTWNGKTCTLVGTTPSCS